MNKLTARCVGLAMLACMAFCCLPARAADLLAWNTNQNRVTADIKSIELSSVLSRVSKATGWKVYLEPGITQKVSTRFKDLPSAEALRLLLADVNFALVPQTNAPSRLYVFRTGMREATSLVHAERGKIIPNELIVRVKPGTDVEALARHLGGKVKGKIDNLNAYRLQFESPEAAEAAREKLASEPEVASVENNYEIDRAPDLRSNGGTASAPLSLQLKPPPANGRIVVGIIDTAVQPLGREFDKFLLPSISVAGQPQLDPSSPSHGTSMVETFFNGLQAATQGSTSVQVLSVDVYGPNTSTSTFDVAMGIIQARNRGANVINLSLGSAADSPVLFDVISAVARENVPIFAAAGNEPTTTPFYPAAYPGVMAVTALDHGELASYANRGSFVSVAAPGTSMVYFDNRPWYVVGTSAASAYTAGLAAGRMETTGSSSQAVQDFLRQRMGFGGK